ncbi:MAG: aminoacyl-histidine dipeptidase [Bacteroidales bacterium]|nr:aminoacyl-histidine dipeptidase [Bacteroidales bacterium]
MSDILNDLEPKAVWRIFEEMCNIPRPSGHEDKIQEFAVDFGEKLNLETIKDEVGNVIIRKPATPGLEDAKGVILQGHLDMVPQKNSNVQHNFETDPITPFIGGEWVKAKGTTLGSDNGIGAAAAMAVLEADDIPHPPLEVLLTAEEETGMTGANGLKPGILKGDILINLDSEDEGELYIGCAGGVNTNAVFPYENVEIPPNLAPYRISVTGLKGGHSGLDIHLGRGNANKIIVKLMMVAADKYGLRLAEIDGGSLRNAIPREAFATVLVNESQKDAFKEFVANYERDAQTALKDADPGLMINVISTKMPRNVMDEESQGNIFKAVDECPNGVIAFDKNMPEVVETSTNLAVVKSTGNQVEMATLQRSAVDDDKDALAKNVYETFEKFNGKPEHSGDYPGWKPDLDSDILKTMKSVYERDFGKVPEVKIIHAGLECGILGAKYPNWDMISFGPTIRNPHSPDEMVNIETVKRFWMFLLQTLKEIPKK